LVKVVSLEKGRELVFNSLKQLQCEEVELAAGLSRVVSSDVVAVIPQPSFDEAVRDGYVVPSVSVDGGRTRKFKIVGDIPAGRPHGNELLPGTACRIMTGGCVPKGGERVVPNEKCVELGDELVVSDHVLQSSDTYIRKTGSEVAGDGVLVKRGVRLQPMQLALLSSSGVRSIAVSTRPCIGFLCTGSELKSPSSILETGQKISSNSFLLQGLSISSGASTEDFGIVADSKADLLDFFVKVKGGEHDLLVTTGGMGPGKYDLVRDAFVHAGGQVIFSALDMRPGKSVLFGKLGEILFFGLPGPPHAVQTLFSILVVPAILAMQGRVGSWPQKVQAALQHPVKVKRNDILRFRDGLLILDGGKCLVRFSGKNEMSNCYILLQSGQTDYTEGELVEVYLVNGF